MRQWLNFSSKDLLLLYKGTDSLLLPACHNAIVGFNGKHDCGLKKTNMFLVENSEIKLLLY